MGTVAAEFFALRKCIHEGNLGELDDRIKEAEKMVSRCHALLDQRMGSFEQRLFSGIDARLRGRQLQGEVRDLRLYLPYAVTINRRPDIAPSYRGRRLEWAIVVCDREYNLIFASWLKRKPTQQQVAAFAQTTHGEPLDWDEDGGRNWLYNDATNPKAGNVEWNAYSDRLRALSRLDCLYDSRWGNETSEDYETALVRWK